MKQTLKGKLGKLQTERVIKGVNERVRKIEDENFNRMRFFKGVPEERDNHGTGASNPRITDLARDNGGRIWKRNTDNDGWEQMIGDFVIKVSGADVESLGTPAHMAMGYTTNDGLFHVFTPVSGWVPMSRYI